MKGSVENTQIVVHARMREREAEAAGERLAAVARSAMAPGSVRRSVGRLLIHAGQRVAGEPVSPGSPAARPARPFAA